MDYEKLHKDTIAKLQEMVNSGKITVEIARGICADFIPENEEERIRKWIIENIQETLDVDGFFEGQKTMAKNAIAWLKKQGETFTKKDVDDAYLKGIADVKREVEKIDEQTEKMKKEIAEFIFNSKEDIKQRYEWIKCLGFDVKFSTL